MRVRRLVAENVNGLIFLAGCECVRRGLELWSSAAALVFAGVIGMTIGAWPYLARTFGSRKP